MKRVLPWGCWLLVSVAGMGSAASFAGDERPTGDCSLGQIASIDLTIGSIVLIPVIGLGKNCDVSASSGPEHSAGYRNCFGSPPLTLGLDVLQHLRLYFATEEHILYVTAADAGRP